MIYDTNGPRTRFAVCWLLGMLAVPALALTLQRWTSSGAIRDGGDVLWVLGITAATVRLLLKLGRLEASRTDPDPQMNLAFEVIVLLPIAGLVPVLVTAGRLP